MAEKNFEHAGLECKVVKTSMGHYCGYVAIPPSHPWHGKGYSDMVTAPREVIDRQISVEKTGAINMLCAGLRNTEEALAHGKIEMVMAIDVHGGLTFARSGKDSDMWWLGFDCAHAGDHPSVQDEAYTEHETRSLADQIAKIGRASTHG